MLNFTNNSYDIYTIASWHGANYTREQLKLQQANESIAAVFKDTYGLHLAVGEVPSKDVLTPEEVGKAVVTTCGIAAMFAAISRVKANEYNSQIATHTLKMIAKENSKIGFNLRDYQRDAVRSAIEAPLGHGILQLPTGAGKTAIGAAIAYCLKGYWLYLASSKELVESNAKKMNSLIGMFANKENKYGAPQAHIIGSTYGGIKKAIAEIDDKCIAAFHGILVDECHQLPAQKRMEAFLKIPTKRRYGLSATPFLRRDHETNKITQAILGPKIYKLDISTLQKAGYLAKEKISVMFVD